MNERLEPRIRVLRVSSIAVGPGKAALLEAIEKTAAIAAAGRRMGMSYRRAWLLSGAYADRPNIAVATPVTRAVSMLGDFNVMPD